MSSKTETDNGVIYLLTSPSGKQYVGQTWDYEKRMRDYRFGNCKGQRALHAAIIKHDWNNFTATIIAQGIQTQEALDSTEIAFIETLGTVSPHGYNLMSGGNGGGKHTAESKAKMSESSRGKRHTTETKTKMSDTRRGRLKSPEHRNNISAAMRGKKNHMFGKHHTSETIAKMSAAKRGIPSPLKGKPLSPEHRAKMSASQQARRARECAVSSNTAPLF